MTLKEATRTLHQEAENSEFTQRLITGRISTAEYRTYLYNMMHVYSTVEWYADRQGLLENLPGLARLRAIKEDFDSIDDGTHCYLMDSTVEYVNYLHRLCNDPTRKNLIAAHLYCRHMGDLFGGQVIRTRIPATEGKFYQFDNATELKRQIREVLGYSNELANEAKTAFRWAIRINQDLGWHHELAK
jgi:heme oxygenase